MALRRISWIDVARGIGIVLVIYGHTLGSNSYRHLIYAFHMPLFFFLSGLVFNYEKYPFITTAKKSVRGILVPYVFFALLSYGIWITQNYGSYLTFELVLKHLGGIIYANSNSLFFNVVLWFLPVLFASKFIFAAISGLLKRDGAIVIALVMLSILGYFLSVFMNGIRLPFGLESVPTAIVFFGFGSLWATRWKSRFEHRAKILGSKVGLLFTGSAFLVFCLILGQMHYDSYGRQIDIRLNNLGNNYSVLYLAAFAGILAVLLFSKVIEKSRILEYLGKLSLVLFALHPIVFFYLGQLLEVVGRYGIHPGSLMLQLIYGVGSIMVLIAVVKLYERGRGLFRQKT